MAWILVASVAGLVAGDAKAASRLRFTVYSSAFAGGALCAALAPQVAPLIAALEAPASRFLLPVFFALTGLRTDLGLLAAGQASWLWCPAIIVAATAGKFGATALAALGGGNAAGTKR